MATTRRTVGPNPLCSDRTSLAESKERIVTASSLVKIQNMDTMAKPVEFDMWEEGRKDKEYRSPVSQMLIGKTPGETFTYTSDAKPGRPAKTITYKVVSIRPKKRGL